jgi:hypothetical protein
MPGATDTPDWGRQTITSFAAPGPSSKRIDSGRPFTSRGRLQAATICFKGQCEKTTLDYECGNIHGEQYGYANGWTVNFDSDKKPTAIDVFRPMRVPDRDLGKITCEGEDACFPALVN